MVSATADRTSLRILAVMARSLYPADTGGRIRSSRLLERVSRLHDITILCFRTPSDHPEHVDMMRVCCSRLETVEWTEAAKFTPRFYLEVASGLLSPLPYTALKYRSREMARRVRTRLATGQYDLLLCDFLQPSVNCLDDPFRPKVLFEHNVEAVIRKRQVQHTPNPLARAFVRLEARKLRRFEQRAARAFDRCIMVSDEDARTMATEYGAFNTSVVPTGVDIDYFSPIPGEGTPLSVVFVGSMDWLPNQEAVAFFVESILPLIRRLEKVSFTVVGRNPPRSILALEGDGVHVTGTVDDVRPFVGNSQVCVVPLRIGGGTRIKIFEAMAMGKAVVSTQVGAEGLPVTHGEDILLANDPLEFADAVVRLLREPELRLRIGEAGRRLVSERYTWDEAARVFSDICVDVVHQAATQQR